MSTESTEYGWIRRTWDSFEPPEGWHAELLAGEIVMQASPSALHDFIIRNLVRQVGAPYEAWGERHIRISERYIPRADAVIVADEDVLLTGNEWPAEIVRVVVEVVSPGREAQNRDRRDKRRWYAEAGIPVYVLVDPAAATWEVLEIHPGTRLYTETSEGVFGHPIAIAPKGGEAISIDTSTWQPYPQGVPS